MNLGTNSCAPDLTVVILSVVVNVLESTVSSFLVGNVLLGVVNIPGLEFAPDTDSLGSDVVHGAVSGLTGSDVGLIICVVAGSVEVQSSVTVSWAAVVCDEGASLLHSVPLTQTDASAGQSEQAGPCL